MIHAQALGKSFAQITAVSELSFSVEPGRIFGLIGPNGAGKTTTARLLSGVVKPSTGEAWIAGRSVIRDARGVRDVIGVVPEGIPLYRRLTARETIRFFGAVHGVPHEELDERIEAIASRVGLSHDLHRPNEGLSLGQKKKVLFASALLHQPPVLICDEPTLGLDPRASRAIITILQELREAGKSLLVTSHDMEMMDSICDCIGVIHKGRIRVEGPPDEIKARLAEETERKEVELDDVFLHYTN
jgi:ABC-type multidrug transport system ATPase subunit